MASVSACRERIKLRLHDPGHSEGKNALARRMISVVVCGNRHRVKTAFNGWCSRIHAPCVQDAVKQRQLMMSACSRLFIDRHRWNFHNVFNQWRLAIHSKRQVVDDSDDSDDSAYEVARSGSQHHRSVGRESGDRTSGKSQRQILDVQTYPRPMI